MKNDTNNDPLWQNLFSDKMTTWMLGIGLSFVLINVVVFAGIDIRPSAWLYLFDMRYWSVYFSMFLWIAAIWVIAEFTDIVEDYLPTLRIVLAIAISLTVIFAMWSFVSKTGLGTQGYSPWLMMLIIIAIGCTVRSLWLLYCYKHSELESHDIEEAQWFWGVSGFVIVTLMIFGLMNIIKVKMQVPVETDIVYYESLYTSCRSGFQELLRSGHGSFALRAFGFLIFTASIAFVYIVGRWILLFTHKVRESWE